MGDNGFAKIIKNYSVVILLIVIAIIHQFIAGPGKLSAWKGGGFGMFSTIESPSSRYYGFTLFSEGQDYKAIIPSEYARDIESLMAWPQQTGLRNLTEKLLFQEWKIQRDSAILKHSESQLFPAYKIIKKKELDEEAEILHVDSVHLTINQLIFDSESCKIKTVPLLFEKVIKHD